MFFNGNGFYPQTTAVISAWFMDRYFDQRLGWDSLKTSKINADDKKSSYQQILTIGDE